MEELTRGNQAISQRPAEAQQVGVSVEKYSANLPLTLNLASPKNTYDGRFLNNHAQIHLVHTLKRIKGACTAMGQGLCTYATRTWLDPARLTNLGLTTTCLRDGAQKQNRGIAAGKLARAPAPKERVYEYPLNTLGRLTNVEQSASIHGDALAADQHQRPPNSVCQNGGTSHMLSARYIRILLLLFPAGLLTGCEEPPPEAPIRPVLATKADDAVKAGDLIAQIAPTDYALALENMQGRVGIEFAKWEYVQAQRIFRDDPDAVGDTHSNQIKMQPNATTAEVRILSASVTQAELTLSYTTLKAPFDGTTVATCVEAFDCVRVQWPIVRLLDTSQAEMVIDVPEGIISIAPYVKKTVVVF